jgi:hypothetical protein
VIEGCARPRLHARAAADAYPRDSLGSLGFLASADSDLIAGGIIAVDGGS